MLIDGREGVAKDQERAFSAEEGTRGCHHCQGVMTRCCWGGCGCEGDEARSLEWARESAGKGSRYGRLTLGMFYYFGGGGLAQDYAQAVAFYRPAAAQGLDEAQCSLGYMYETDDGVAQHCADALRWFQLAAAQGHLPVMYFIAVCHEEGRGVPADEAAAVRWYRRPQAAV
jgi:TPR repeat protein